MAEISVLPRLMVSSFTVVQGPETLFKFETKSLDNETTPPPCVSSFFLSLPYSMIYHFLGFFRLLSASEVELEIVGWTGSDSFLSFISSSSSLLSQLLNYDNVKHLFSFTGLESIPGNAKYQTVIDIGRII